MASAGAGSRDWRAEEAELDREYAEAKAAMDVAFEAVRPGSPTRTVATDDLLTFGAVKERFEAVKARRKAFIQERVARENANP